MDWEGVGVMNYKQIKDLHRELKKNQEIISRTYR